MKKKAFTLIEMTVVVAILGILLTIAYINFGSLHSKSQVDSVANDIASILKDAYENSNKSMDYQDYYTQIIQNNGIYSIELKNKDNQVRISEYKNIEIELKMDTTTLNIQNNNYIFFTPDGEALLKHDKSEAGERINKIIIKSKSGNNSKTVNINSLPPGNITVE